MDKRLIIGGVLSVSILALIVYVLFFKKDAVFKKKPTMDDLLEKEKAQKAKNPLTLNASATGGYTDGGYSSNGGFPMQQGTYSEKVRILQSKLNAAGFNVGTADSSWGSKTASGLKNALNKTSIVSQADFDEVISKLDAIINTKSSSNGNQMLLDTSASSGNVMYDNSRINKKAFALYRMNTRTKPFGGSDISKTFDSGEEIGTLTGRFVKNGEATWYEYTTTFFLFITTAWAYEGSFTVK